MKSYISGTSRVCKNETEKMQASHLIVHRPPETPNSASIQREQNFLFLAQFSKAFRLYIPVLVAFLQLNPPPQSEIHPPNLYSFSFIVTALIYYLSYSAFTVYTKLNIPHSTNSQLFGVIAFISGSLSSILLICSLVSHLTEIIFLILWFLLSLLVTVHQRVPLNKKETYEMVGEKMKNIKIPEKISSLWRKKEPELPRDG